MSKKRHRLTNLKRWELRRELLDGVCEGYTLSSLIDALTKSYDVTPKVIYNEWQRRETWIPTLAKLKDPDKVMDKLLLEMEHSRLRGWNVYRQALRNKNENAAVGALKHVSETIMTQVKILQSIGKVTQAATKIDAFITTPDTLPWEKIPEVKLALEQIREKLAQEKAAEENVAAET